MEKFDDSWLSGMLGLTLDQMRGAVLHDRFGGEVTLCLDAGRWLVLFGPRRDGRGRWVGRTSYLKAETAGHARRFVRADTALRVAQKLAGASGVWVYFERPLFASLVYLREVDDEKSL